MNFILHDEIGVGNNEYVSEKKVKVLEEIVIPNVWEYLNSENLKIYRYPNRPKTYPINDEDLIECATLMYT